MPYLSFDRIRYIKKIWIVGAPRYRTLSLSSEEIYSRQPGPDFRLLINHFPRISYIIPIQFQSGRPDELISNRATKINIFNFWKAVQFYVIRLPMSHCISYFS